MTLYGVFILQNGNWRLIMTCESKVCAEQERDYWRRAMGVTSEIFRKL